jgi:hypothetical protein
MYLGGNTVYPSSRAITLIPWTHALLSCCVPDYTYKPDIDACNDTFDSVLGYRVAAFARIYKYFNANADAGRHCSCNSTPHT